MTGSQLDKIRTFTAEEMKKSLDPQHDFVHLERVRTNALRIADLLDLNGAIDRNLLSAICYLHDLAFTARKPGLRTWFFEGRFVKKRLKRLTLLDRLGVSQEEKRIMFTAIIRHPLAFPLRRLNRRRDYYTQLLQDADTLDFYSAERLASFTVSRQRFLFYRVCSVFAGFSHRLYHRNIHKYLNFPQLAEHFL